MYIALAPEGSYTVTTCEHMGIWVESGRWSKSGARFTFTPDKSGKARFNATEVTYRKHTFLALEGDSGPSIAVPIEETKRNLDQNHKTVPPYVFFEVSPSVYQRETKQTYPFRFLSSPNQP
jgi:hypothetical protein